MARRGMVLLEFLEWFPQTNFLGAQDLLNSLLFRTRFAHTRENDGAAHHELIGSEIGSPATD